MTVIGYARVSTTFQKYDSQLSVLRHYGCDKIFCETESGTKKKRAELEQAIQTLKAGDVFVVYRLDRLSRGTKHLLELIENFEEQDIHFVSVKDNIDTTTPMGKFFFTIMGAFAEMEAALIRERILAGLHATRERGTALGRPTNDLQRSKVLKLAKLGLSAPQIIEKTRIPKSTVYRYLRNDEEAAPFLKEKQAK